MVRIALMRMMADEEREHAHNAACLTKFSELLLLNGILSTEQMWQAFALVGDMYHASGTLPIYFTWHATDIVQCNRPPHADLLSGLLLSCTFPSGYLFHMQARDRRSCQRWSSGWSTPTLTTWWTQMRVSMCKTLASAMHSAQGYVIGGMAPPLGILSGSARPDT